MTTTEAEIEVICPGMLEVLSVGKGDIKLTVSGTDEEIEKGRRVIEEMLRKGYTIFVETDDGPARVHEFNPKRMTYTISDLPDETALAAAPERPELPPGASMSETPQETAAKKKPGRPRKAKTKEVPVAGSKATAVGKTAGG